MESDEEFIARLKNSKVMYFHMSDWNRLFALARRGAAGIMPLLEDKEQLKTQLSNLKGVAALKERRLSEAAARIEKLEAALHRISLGSQNSGTTKEDLGRYARAALEEEPTND